MYRRQLLQTIAITAALGFAGMAHAQNTPLKIGFVGVTSGPAAAWGTSNVRSMETLAAWLNEQGGVKIGDTTYDVEIVTFDDQKDPKRAIAGMEKMAQEGIHYVVGPNVDDGAAAVRPVAEQNGIIYFPYAFPKSLYVAPASNAVLGHGGELPVGSGDLQVPDGEQGGEEGRLRRGERIRPAQPARRRRRGGQGARPRGRLLGRDLPGRHHRLHARCCCRCSRPSRTCWCSPASTRPTRRS